MTHFRHTFMGINGFEDLKRYTHSGTEFGREIVRVLSERCQLEQMYSKSLRRLGQRISKASCLIITSPLSNAWNTVGLEMEKEAEIHREFCGQLHEKCIRPLSELTETQLKPRKLEEQRVEGSYKVWSDKYAEHTKLKKRLHVQRKENEILTEQIDGPRTRNEKEHQRLVSKQVKSEETVQRGDGEYYNSLITLERSRQDWELQSFHCCDAIENMEDDRYREICHIIKHYADVLYDIPHKMKSCCRVIDDAVEDVSPSREIGVVAEKCRGAEYLSEQLLCDYYQENFNFPMAVGRRKHSLGKLLERYINDYQKESVHRDGLRRLQEKSTAHANNDVDIQSRLMQSTSMLNYLDVIRFKLSRTLATIDGSSYKPTHIYEKQIEENVDKQGIKFSILKLRPGNNELDKQKEKNKRKSKNIGKLGGRTSSTEGLLDGYQPSSSSSGNKNKYYNTVSAGTASSLVDDRRPSSSSSSSSSQRGKQQYSGTVRGMATMSLAAPPNQQQHDARRSSKTPSLKSQTSLSSHDEAVSMLEGVPPPASQSESPPSYENIDKEPTPAAPASGSEEQHQAVLCQCVAIYNYEATRPDELTICENDVIEVYEKGADQWWRGKRLRTSADAGAPPDLAKVGLFPANYVEMLNTI